VNTESERARDRRGLDSEEARIHRDLSVELRSLARVERIDTDVKERRFVEHTLQVCIQAAQDVASHVVSDQRLGEPSVNTALFSLLAQASWLSEETARFLRAAVGFRNVLVHGYIAVDPEVLRDVLENHLGDIAQFVAEVRARLRTD
jgi:uncharacterized protein YutE (UPF0331/DUF86 family)